LWDVAFTMAKYSTLTITQSTLPNVATYGFHPCNPPIPPQIGNRHSSISAQFGGHTTTKWNPPISPQPGLLWSVPNGGPTGDLTNEIIFTQGNFPGITGGFASMIVEPVSGSIVECDVIFVESGIAIPASAPPGTPCTQAHGGPSSTVLINHELGHFFGLDHTNLHTGTYGPGPVPLTPAPVNGAPPTAAAFTALNQYPAMVSNAGAQMGFWITDPLWPLHPDEAAAMATIYPVIAPDPPTATAQKRPVINDFGRIEGLVTYVLGDRLLNTWGLNVFPLLTAAPQAPSPPQNPAVGAVVGMARLQSGSGVVGSMDTSTGTLCSGGFRLNGVPANTPGATTYSCRVESLESLGFFLGGGAALAWGEWFQPPVANPPLFPNAPPAWGSAAPALTISSRFAHQNSRGTLFVYPGTVLSLNLNIAVTTSGPEAVTRPAIQITPRNGRTVPWSGNITATVEHDYELDFSSARWQVVGGSTVLAGTPPTTTTQPPSPQGSTGPWITTWTIQAQSILPDAGTATLRFTCVELGTTGNPQDTHRPPPGITPVWGVNEVGF
jgi:hypothetical protein